MRIAAKKHGLSCCMPCTSPCKPLHSEDSQLSMGVCLPISRPLILISGPALACTAPRAAWSTAGSSRTGSPGARWPPARPARPPRPLPPAGCALSAAGDRVGGHMASTGLDRVQSTSRPARARRPRNRWRTHCGVAEVAHAHGLRVAHAVPQMQQRRKVRAIVGYGRRHVLPPPGLGGQQRVDVLRHLLCSTYGIDETLDVVHKPVHFRSDIKELRLQVHEEIPCALIARSCALMQISRPCQLLIASKHPQGSCKQQHKRAGIPGSSLCLHTSFKPVPQEVCNACLPTVHHK